MRTLQATHIWLARRVDRLAIFLIKRLMAGRHDVIPLEDGTRVVRMSEDFHNWVYGRGYVIWKETK